MGRVVINVYVTSGTDLSVFIQDMLKGFDVTKISSGQPVRTQEGFVLGGMNGNKSVMGQVKIETYVISDPIGLQFMNRYYFPHPV